MDPPSFNQNWKMTGQSFSSSCLKLAGCLVKLSFVSRFALPWVLSGRRSWSEAGRQKERGRERRRKGGRGKRKGREEKRRRGKRKEKRKEKKVREGRRKAGNCDLPTGRPAAAARQHAIGTGRQHNLFGGALWEDPKEVRLQPCVRWPKRRAAQNWGSFFGP